MNGKINRIFNPAWYHGKNKRKSFFEGWYYKLVSADERHSMSIIPGVFQHRYGANSISFIQCIETVTGKSNFIEFPIDVFRTKTKKFEIDIGGNQFQTDKINVDIKKDNLSLKADLTFNHLNPWPISLISPGIMGWYAWVPFMECFHGVLSLDHTIEGTVSLNGEDINFSGGKGYIEKDWGTAFPEAWVWQQTNHFTEGAISLTASIAIIPWIRKSFPGFIIGFLWDGKLYRFTTYTGAETKLLEIHDHEIIWIVADKKFILEMHTRRGPGLILKAPTINGMERQIKESIQSEVDIRLYQRIKTGKTLIYQGTGRNAGLEVEGNINRLLTMIKQA